MKVDEEGHEDCERYPNSNDHDVERGEVGEVVADSVKNAHLIFPLVGGAFPR